MIVALLIATLAKVELRRLKLWYIKETSGMCVGTHCKMGKGTRGESHSNSKTSPYQMSNIMGISFVWKKVMFDSSYFIYCLHISQSWINVFLRMHACTRSRCGSVRPPHSVHVAQEGLSEPCQLIRAGGNKRDKKQNTNRLRHKERPWL